MTEAAGAPEQPLLHAQTWEDLLDFLDPDRPGKRGPGRDSEAEAGYLETLRKLVCFFAGRGCRDAEDMAMECLLRVAAKCAGLDASARANRAAYFYGVARNVLHEWWRREQRDSRRRDSLRLELGRAGWPDGQAWSRKERVHTCLDRCMEKLTPRARQLVLDYYGEQGAAKFEAHRKLADELGKSVNALRIDVHRIRATLRQCVGGCVQEGGGASRG
jgi:RNA polymerase sigma factor (sigma-70 family)